MKFSTYVLILLVVMIVASVGIYEYNSYLYPSQEKVKEVKVGDKISVYYYGYIYYGGERRIFDTNIEKVAKDNITYPKTLTYKWTGNFKPLTFVVGNGTMIKGFEEGVVGMRLHETKTIVVPPDKGYKFDWSKVKNESLTQTVPVIENMTLNVFQKRFGVSNPYMNSVYRDKIHGWDCLVIYVSGPKNLVTIENMPDAGKDYQPFPTPDLVIHVDKISGGNITYTYEIKKLPILLPSGGVIDYVNYEGGYFRINFNPEVAGKTLYFVVTIESIE